MAKIFTKRQQKSFGIEQVDLEKLNRAAKKLQVHPSWLVNQAINLAIDNPSALFDNMKRKFQNGL